MLIDEIAVQVASSNEFIDESVSCRRCEASCCRLEVMLISDTGVPDTLISEDNFGSQVMTRLDDGWCAALNRETLLCTIYENRPLICREFEMGAFECLAQRKAEGI